MIELLKIELTSGSLISCSSSSSNPSLSFSGKQYCKQKLGNLKLVKPAISLGFRGTCGVGSWNRRLQSSTEYFPFFLLPGSQSEGSRAFYQELLCSHLGLLGHLPLTNNNNKKNYKYAFCNNFYLKLCDVTVTLTL